MSRYIINSEVNTIIAYDISETANYNSILGAKNNIDGNYNAITGVLNVVNGNYNTVIGTNNKITGDYNIVIGNNITYTGNHYNSKTVINDMIYKNWLVNDFNIVNDVKVIIKKELIKPS